MVFVTWDSKVIIFIIFYMFKGAFEILTDFIGTCTNGGAARSGKGEPRATHKPH